VSVLIRKFEETMNQIFHTPIGDRDVPVDAVPNECPLCFSKIEPIDLNTVNRIWNKKFHMETEIEQVLKCPASDCSRIFIARYSQVSIDKETINGYFTYKGCIPVEFVESPQTEQVLNVSPLFCEIFNQALFSERMGLLQISGVGYRKALEHLIKDFCIFEHPKKEESIKKSLLMACIKTHIEDRNILECAKRAVWLGNDETHYVRKWDSKDISDLKRLTNLVCHWISSHLITKEYLISMPE
jgi:hypothetical protein